MREASAEIGGGNSGQRCHLPHSRAVEKRCASNWIEWNFNEVIQEAAYLVRNQATGNGVTMRLDLSTDLPLVRGDRVQLQQVLTNLIINGVDAMCPLDDGPRKLGIKSARDARAVVVQVRDSGTGFDPEQTDRTFEPLFTLNRSLLPSRAALHWDCRSAAPLSSSMVVGCEPFPIPVGNSSSPLC